MSDLVDLLRREQAAYQEPRAVRVFQVDGEGPDHIGDWDLWPGCFPRQVYDDLDTIQTAWDKRGLRGGRWDRESVLAAVVGMVARHEREGQCPASDNIRYV
jgi:hypothetical protein